MRCKAWNCAFLAGGVVAAMGAGAASGQSFQDGDLYLLSASLPNSPHAGMIRIDQSTWQVTVVCYSSTFSSGQGSYDAFRDRIIVPHMPSGPGLGAVAADGTFTEIPDAGSSANNVAASTDGRIYFVVNSNHLRFVDTDGSVHDVYDANAALATIPTTFTSMWYDAGTRSLFVGEGFGTAMVIEKISLSQTGDHITGRTSCPAASSIPSGSIKEFSTGPSGTFFVAIDDNSNNTLGRLQLFDPVAMSCSVFATTGYFGVGGEVAGAYLSNSGLGLALDTLNDELRVYHQGETGAGTIVANSGVSSGGGSGELCQFVVIHRGCRADFNQDGFVDFFDFSDFVTCFEDGQCPPGTSADYNGDGFADFFDFSDFVTDFETGC